MGRQRRRSRRRDSPAGLGGDAWLGAGSHLRDAIVTSVEDAVAAIRRWGEAHDWRGYDPYDALNSPISPFLTLGTGLGRRVLTQAVKRSPVNLRPLLWIRPTWNA